MNEKDLSRHIPYNPSLTAKARNLRNNPTPPEKYFWNALRAMPFYQTTRINRQKPLGEYIIDFYCHEFRLVIEIDGDTHAGEEAQIKDEVRTKYLEGQGLRVLRFSNREVLNNIEGVMKVLQTYFERNA
ncbi:MAG: endonuclease domain-containing protein [Nitrospinota bacterium]|nr:endonuclease domain-containing protein [Nitrospinota bacterium]